MKITLRVAAIIAAIAAFAAVGAYAQTGVAAIKEEPPIPAAQIPEAITNAVNSPDRPTADRELDAGRKPEQVFAFFGIKPGMKVADLFAGGGSTTELLARIVGPSGTVYSQNMTFPPRFKKIEDAWHERLKAPAFKNVVAVSKQFDAPDLLPVAPGSLDAVLINLNYHDLVLFKIDRANMNKAVFKALKPGGVYGIVDHAAKDGSGDQGLKLHRIEEDFVVKEVQKAGFKLAAASSALRHPEDDRTQNVFKIRGKTDRFTLKFVKPE